MSRPPRADIWADMSSGGQRKVVWVDIGTVQLRHGRGPTSGFHSFAREPKHFMTQWALAREPLMGSKIKWLCAHENRPRNVLPQIGMVIAKICPNSRISFGSVHDI